MKHSEMSKLTQEHTTKMEGKALVNEPRTLLRDNSIGNYLRKLADFDSSMKPSWKTK